MKSTTASKSTYPALGRRPGGRTLAAIVALLLGFSPGAPARATEVTSAPEIRRTIDMGPVASDGTTVRSELRNRTDLELRNVRLLVVHEFRWTEEMSPGDDNPGRTETAVVERVPPRGVIPFVHSIEPPLPQRADGTFATRIDVTGFTEVGP